jgi:hypothetical protein
MVASPGTGKPDPDTAEPIGRTGRGGLLFHTIRTDGTGLTSCGTQPDEVLPNEVVPDRKLPPDARPCCRCFGLTRQQSQEWMQRRMQVHMANLLETRSRLSARDPLADLADLADLSGEPLTTDQVEQLQPETTERRADR